MEIETTKQETTSAKVLREEIMKAAEQERMRPLSTEELELVSGAGFFRPFLN